MQRYVNDVKSDITREMQLEELRKLQAEMEQTARSIETSVTQEVRSAEDELNKITRDASMDAAAAPLSAPPPGEVSGDTAAANTQQLPLDLDSAPAPRAGDRPA
jgi:sec-independent protein translocase protein TatB